MKQFHRMGRLPAPDISAGLPPRTRRVAGIALAAAVVLLVAGGCADIVPGGGVRTGTGVAAIEQEAVESYLAKLELNRPEIVRRVTLALRRGERFRDRVKDRRNRWTLLTVWIAAREPNVLHVTTMRNEKCPVCNGTGDRNWGVGFMEKAPFATDCLKCKGAGVLKNQVSEYRFLLSPEDTVDPLAAREQQREVAFGDAPAGVRERIDALASESPQERLEATRWLDAQYVREGESFQKYLPMLRKARFRENSPEQQKMVYEFWAGKGDPRFRKWAYYRIYIDNQTGRVLRKGFYPER